MIVFTTEPQAFLDDVAKRRPNWLGFHFEAEVPKLKTMNRPIQAWYSTVTLVVIDTKTIIDYPVGSIVDYIGMMVLAQTQITEDCGGLPSILELMTPKCRGTAPDSITAGDVAYLKALYSIDLAHVVAMQRSSIGDVMIRSFTGHE
jgi:hypothetical protein